MPESPRFLLSRGREKEAEEILEKWEGAPLGGKEVSPGDLSQDPPNPLPGRVGFKELWSPRYLRRTLCLWILWFAMVYSYYGIFVWLPSLLVASGYTLIRSFRFVLLITLAQIPGYYSAAFLVDRIGRKCVLTSYLFLCAIAAYFFGKAGSVGEIIMWGSLISFFNLGAWGVVYTYTPELYPTRVRGTGSGWAAAFGRLGGIIAPAMVGSILGSWGGSHREVFGMFALVLLIGAADVALLGEETKGKSLEEIAA
jgi:putative MFS transporter